MLKRLSFTKKSTPDAPRAKIRKKALGASRDSDKRQSHHGSDGPRQNHVAAPSAIPYETTKEHESSATKYVRNDDNDDDHVTASELGPRQSQQLHVATPLHLQEQSGTRHPEPDRTVIPNGDEKLLSEDPSSFNNPEPAASRRHISALQAWDAPEVGHRSDDDDDEGDPAFTTPRTSMSGSSGRGHFVSPAALKDGTPLVLTSAQARPQSTRAALGVSGDDLEERSLREDSPTLGGLDYDHDYEYWTPPSEGTDSLSFSRDKENAGFRGRGDGLFGDYWAGERTPDREVSRDVEGNELHFPAGHVVSQDASYAHADAASSGRWHHQRGDSRGSDRHRSRPSMQMNLPSMDAVIAPLPDKGVTGRPGSSSRNTPGVNGADVAPTSGARQTLDGTTDDINAVPDARPRPRPQSTPLNPAVVASAFASSTEQQHPSRLQPERHNSTNRYSTPSLLNTSPQPARNHSFSTISTVDPLPSNLDIQPRTEPSTSHSDEFSNFTSTNVLSAENLPPGSGRPPRMAPVIAPPGATTQNYSNTPSGMGIPQGVPGLDQNPPPLTYSTADSLAHTSTKKKSRNRLSKPPPESAIPHRSATISTSPSRTPIAPSAPPGPDTTRQPQQPQTQRASSVKKKRTSLLSSLFSTVSRSDSNTRRNKLTKPAPEGYEKIASSGSGSASSRAQSATSGSAYAANQHVAQHGQQQYYPAPPAYCERRSYFGGETAGRATPSPVRGAPEIVLPPQEETGERGEDAASGEGGHVNGGASGGFLSLPQSGHHKSNTMTTSITAPPKPTQQATLPDVSTLDPSSSTQDTTPGPWSSTPRSSNEYRTQRRPPTSTPPSPPGDTVASNISYYNKRDSGDWEGDWDSWAHNANGSMDAEAKWKRQRHISYLAEQGLFQARPVPDAAPRFEREGYPARGVGAEEAVVDDASDAASDSAAGRRRARAALETPEPAPQVRSQQLSQTEHSSTAWRKIREKQVRRKPAPSPSFASDGAGVGVSRRGTEGEEEWRGEDDGEIRMNATSTPGDVWAPEIRV